MFLSRPSRSRRRWPKDSQVDRPPTSIFVARRRIFLIAFIIIYGLLITRLFYLQVIRHNFFLTKTLQQRQRTLELPALRGDIYDSQGQPLATSLPVFSIYVDPQMVKDKEAAARTLSQMFGLDYGTVASKLNSPNAFQWLKRRVEVAEVEKIRQAQLDYIGIVEEQKRFYPQGFLASHVLGFVGTDNEGLAGLELSLEKQLQGQSGFLTMETDPFGRPLNPADRRTVAPTVGRNIYLTVDSYIQYVAQRELSKACQKFRAQAGTAIVMEPKTGRILALSNWPDYDPNNYNKYPPVSWRNRAVGEIYEPGSTFKVITVSCALEQKTVTPETVFNCPNEIRVGGWPIGEAHDAIGGHGQRTVMEIVQDSLNVGAAQIAMTMKPARFERSIRQFGFGQRTGIELPGEEKGWVPSGSGWSASTPATIGFGQGISLTPLQLITAVASIANGGNLMKPTIIDRIVGPNFFYSAPAASQGQTVSPATTALVRQMMELVVTKGTGTVVRIVGYQIGGKTGTAQIPVPGGRGGYLQGHHIGSFVGFLPLADPQIAILVVVADPALGTHYGGEVAAPAFRDIAWELIRYLNIPGEASKPLIDYNEKKP